MPKLDPLARDSLSGDAFVFEGAAQPAVLSSEPGRADYTPAWRLHRVRWESEPRRLRSVGEVADAERAGDVSVERTEIVVNVALVKWSSGELPGPRARTGDVPRVSLAVSGTLPARTRESTRSCNGCASESPASIASSSTCSIGGSTSSGACRSTSASGERR